MNRGILCIIEKNFNSRHVTTLKLTMKLLKEFMSERDMKKRIIQSVEHTAAVRISRLYAEVSAHAINSFSSLNGDLVNNKR